MHFNHSLKLYVYQTSCMSKTIKKLWFQIFVDWNRIRELQTTCHIKIEANYFICHKFHRNINNESFILNQPVFQGLSFVFSWFKYRFVIIFTKTFSDENWRATIDFIMFEVSFNWTFITWTLLSFNLFFNEIIISVNNKVQYKDLASIIFIIPWNCTFAFLLLNSCVFDSFFEEKNEILFEHFIFEI